MPDFALNDAVTIKPLGEHATIVALPDEVFAVEGLRGHYRVKMADASKGWRYVAAERLMKAETPFANDAGALRTVLEALAYHADLFKQYEDYEVAYEAVGDAAEYQGGKPIIRAEAIHAAAKLLAAQAADGGAV